MGVLALSYIGLFALTTLGLGWPLVARLDRQGALTVLERGSVAFGLGTIALYLAVFAIGSWRLDTVSMGVLSLAALVLAVPGLRAIPWRGLAGLKARAAGLCPAEAAFWLLLAGTLLAALLQGMASPNDYDSLMYHLAAPKLDVEKGIIAPAWDRGMPHFFFPALTGNLYRLVLATIGERPVQMIGGLFGIAASAATAALALRMGLGRKAALAAALMFAASRVVVWEMATAEVEVPLALFAAAATAVMLAWRDSESPGLILLCGLMLGGGLLVKFHGGAVAIALGVPLLAWVALKPYRLVPVAVAGTLGLVLFVPHAAMMAALTGNPLFPMFNQVFTPGGVDFFGELRGLYGIGRGPLAMVLAPWALSVDPMRHFDGMVLGAPYFLALVPLATLFAPGLRHCWPVAAAAVVYYVIWFHLLSQQVRFLVPIFPLLAVFAAAGAAGLWRAAQPWVAARVAVAALLGLFTLNQAMFVGIYAALRLPPALGLMDAATYHTKTPTLTGAFFITCGWVSAHLRPGERVLSLLVPHSYYCPQAAATHRLFAGEDRAWLRAGKLPPMSRDEFVRRYREMDFRWVIVPTAHENRRNNTGEPVLVTVDLARDRFGTHLAGLLGRLEPVAKDPFTAVYDGRAIGALLEQGN